MALTARQTQFYDLLKACIAEQGKSPTLAELKEYLEAHGWGEIRSLNSLTQYLEALESAGRIRRESRKRGISLAEEATTVQVPVLGSPVACGSPTTLLEEEAVDHHTISRRLVRSPERTYLFRATGDSMDLAGIGEGDYVLVEATSDLRDGEIVLATIDGCGTLKRLRRGDGTLTLLPQSSNPAHKPIYLSEEDDFIIGGRVIHIFKS
jgi:repressor LexA